MDEKNVEDNHKIDESLQDRIIYLENEIKIQKENFDCEIDRLKNKIDFLETIIYSLGR